jgi:molybdopterin-guanine dinucleotide biosynthesis protein A
LIRHAFILAGGKSSRFGSDKALADVGGMTSIQSLAHSLLVCQLDVVVVAQNERQYDSLGLVTIGDSIPDQGPLGGILTAITHFRNSGNDGWILVTTCDSIHFESCWLEQLKACMTPSVRAIHFDDGQRQPFPGLYHTSLYNRLTCALASNSRSMLAFLDSLNAECISIANASNRKPLHFNTPEQLEECLRTDTGE